MKKIESDFKDEDKIFKTIMVGIPLKKLKNFCKATYCPLSDYFYEGRHYVPGVYLISMFRYIVKKIHKENPSFPLEKINSFYGHNGGTIENRVFIGEELVYGLKYLSKDKEGKIQFAVEISRKTTKDVVLKGIFQFVV